MTSDTIPAIPAGTRRRLPDRRGHELLDFEHGGIHYTAGVGRFEDGAIAEVFLNTAKCGTAVDSNARDAAVAASLLLQHGCPVDVLQRALTRNADGLGFGTAGARIGLTLPRMSRPAVIPSGSWPRRMSAELAAGYCGEPTAEAFMARVGREYPRPRIHEGRRQLWLRDRWPMKCDNL
jgi:hypothetical protein